MNDAAMSNTNRIDSPRVDLFSDCIKPNKTQMGFLNGNADSNMAQTDANMMQVGPAQTDANNGQMDSLIVDLSTALDESEKSFRRKRHHRRRASRGEG